MNEPTQEPSIENVLKELKQGSSDGETAKSVEKLVPSEDELKNLKNVLEKVDAEEGFSPAPPAAAPQMLSSGSEKGSALPDFNENFLKLERLIKEIKAKK